MNASAVAPADGRRAWILAIDTATSQIVVAAGLPDGELLGATTWVAGYRHGERLLPAIGRLHGELNLRRSRIAGIVVGTGPGAFTGLRVGLATAKALAHGLHRPIAGVSTATALLEAAAVTERMPLTQLLLLLPAGPSDRTVVRSAMPPRLLPGGQEPDRRPDDVLVAVDLDGRAPADAAERGERARARLAAELLRLGATRLRTGGDDLARLVPDYVTLPRGIIATGGEVSWSRESR